MLDIVERILAALIILALVSLLIVLASRSGENDDGGKEPAPPAKIEKEQAPPAKVEKRTQKRTETRRFSTKDTAHDYPEPVLSPCGSRRRPCDGSVAPRRVAARPWPCSSRGSDYDDRPCRADWYPEDYYAPPSRRPCGPRYGRPEPCECEEKWRPYWARYRYAGGCDD